MDKSAKQTNGVKFRLQSLQSSNQCKVDYSTKQKNGVKQLCKAAIYLHMMSQHECPQSLNVIF